MKIEDKLTESILKTDRIYPERYKDLIQSGSSCQNGSTSENEKRI